MTISLINQSTSCFNLIDVDVWGVKTTIPVSQSSKVHPPFDSENTFADALCRNLILSYLLCGESNDVMRKHLKPDWHVSSDSAQSSELY